MSGADRYAVSAALLTHSRFGLPESPSPVIYVASGSTFPDALSATPAAVANRTGILLVDGSASTLSPASAGALAALDISEVRLVGRPAVLSDELHADIAGRFDVARRIAGIDPYWTSQRVNAQAFPAWVGRPDFFLARRIHLPDALAGGVLAGMTGAPLTLARPDCIAFEDSRYFGTLTPKRITLFGGRASLTDAVTALHTCP